MTWPTLAGPLTNDFVDMIHSGSRTAIKVSREDVEVNQPSLIDVIRESQRIAGKTAAKVVEMGERLIATFDTATGKISVTDINGKEYGFGRLRKDVSQPTSKEWALSLNGKDTNHPTRGTALSHAVRYLEGIHRDAAKDPRFKGVSVDQDDEGYYVKTHRARSKSYPSEDAIPDSVVAEIERTGSKTAFQVHRVGMHDAETTVTLASGTTMTLYYWGSPSWSRAVKAETPAGAEAGYLTWDSRKIIGGVHTQPRWRRQGLATAMLEFARSFDPDIRHSHALTEDGEAWADKVGKSALCTEGSFGYYMREHRDMASLGPDHELVKPRTLTELRRFAQEVMDRVSG